MANNKLKSESYQNFGGMNSKASPYVTGPMEFLNLINFDFQTPGSLTERWGSTMYVGQTFSAPLSMLQEYTKLMGNSYVIMGTSFGVWSGATTGQAQGLSFSYFGATQPWYAGGAGADGDFNVTFSISGANIFWNTAAGLNQFVPRTQALYYQGYQDRSNTFELGKFINQYGIMSNTVWGASGNCYNGIVFEDYFYASDGNKSWKYNGVTTFSAQLIPPFINEFFSDSFSNTIGTIGGDIQLGFGLSGWVALYASYTNNRGVEGPIWPFAVVDAQSIAGSTANSLGGNIYKPRWKFTTLPSYGISTINIYSYTSGVSIGVGSSEVWDLPYVQLSNWPVVGGITSITEVPIGTTFGGLSDMYANNFSPPVNPAYIPMGISIMLGTTTGLGTGITAWSFGAYSPRFLEIYQNRMFLGGFSSTPSTVWFSDTAEPEGYLADYNFEVRTNDGDVVTCMRSYSTRLYVFKRKSFHVLQGDNPNNFFLSQITTQYGCLNNNCSVVYDDILVFLDQKGVIMWNGANLQVLSSKIQPVFDTMNYNVAVQTACLVHDKLRNQVLIGIPINGSTTNNITLVYDYLIGAWTTYSGFTPSIFAAIQGRNNTKNAFYGDTSGRVNWFGSSFLADNGTGFTTYLKTRFLHDMGESTQKMFRRMFINADSPASSTLVFNVNFFQDYGSTIVLGTTMILSQFQNRIDYGVSAKSLAFEMANIQTTIPIKIHGFTIESRFMRRV